MKKIYCKPTTEVINTQVTKILCESGWDDGFWDEGFAQINGVKSGNESRLV